MPLNESEKVAFEQDLGEVLRSHGIDELTGCTGEALTEFVAECLYTFGQTSGQVRLETTGERGTAYVRINPSTPPVSPPPILADPPLTGEDVTPEDRAEIQKLREAGIGPIQAATDVIARKLDEATAAVDARPESLFMHPDGRLARKLDEAKRAKATPEGNDDVPPGA